MYNVVVTLFLWQWWQSLINFQILLSKIFINKFLIIISLLQIQNVQMSILENFCHLWPPHHLFWAQHLWSAPHPAPHSMLLCRWLYLTLSTSTGRRLSKSEIKRFTKKILQLLTLSLFITSQRGQGKPWCIYNKIYETYFLHLTTSTLRSTQLFLLLSENSAKLHLVNEKS